MTLRPRPLRRSSRRGAAMIELALMLPILIVTFGAVLEMSNYMSKLHIVSRAARDAARVASITIEGPDADGTEITAEAEAQAKLVLEAAGYGCDADCTVDATWELNAETGYYFVEVEVRYPYDAFTSLIPQLGTHIVGRFTIMTQQQ